MALYKRGGVFHYDFAMDGKRYRGTTKESVSSKARMIEAKLMNEAKQRKLTVQRRTLTLAEFSKRFLAWVETTRLEAKTKEVLRHRMENARSNTYLRRETCTHHNGRSRSAPIRSFASECELCAPHVT